MLSSFNNFIVPILYKLSLFLYRNFYLPIRIRQIRNKQTIKVAFVVSELSKWKSETLFIKMQESERFDPFIFVVPYTHNDNSGLTILTKYLQKQNYPYHLFDNKQRFSDVVRPDILFYQEPYKDNNHSIYRYNSNLFSLFCYVGYGYHWMDADWNVNRPFKNFCWQIYFENQLAMKNVPKLMTNKGANCIVTGLPMTEHFIKPLSVYDDPWKIQNHPKIRIIWAPHYTIKQNSRFHYSTFLSYCDFMLEIAAKYMDKVQIAFKPHPLLLTKLYQLWGKDKTDGYYKKWEEGDNTQLVLGEYVSLFMTSNAMIHDCGTFTIEYHYTHNPVLYLLNGSDHYKDLNEFGKLAFDLHYKGESKEDIELFINNVIDGIDPMKEARQNFYNDLLLPPNGNSASTNIINAILGKS